MPNRSAPNRRHVLAGLAAGLAAPRAIAAPARAEPAALARALARRPPADADDPAAAAGDEDFWSGIQRAYTVDRSIVNFNNGGVSPAPAVVQDAMARHLAFSNQAPAYTMWRVLEPQREGVRQRLARHHGVDAEELALTRNASEGLQTLQFGFDLEPGDQVLCTDQDYPRMRTTFRQRARREGIELVEFPIPTPCEDGAEIVRRYAERVTDRTKLILVSHVVFLTGQALPVTAVTALGRERGIPVLVDGAHALHHLDVRLGDLDVDFYATSLHKWLCAPHGTGLLYVRRERIPAVWPLMAADEARDDDVRKFEEVGTHPAANHLAVAEALSFHESIGPARKLARLVRLRDRWARRLLEDDRVRLHTSLAPGLAGGFACVEVDGVEPGDLVQHLWREHRIFTVAIGHEDFRGVRVSPHVYSTPAEVDRFADAVEAVLANGLPG